jgi:hypothetical protein
MRGVEGIAMLTVLLFVLVGWVVAECVWHSYLAGAEYQRLKREGRLS